jgi:hypothetical protein
VQAAVIAPALPPVPATAAVPEPSPEIRTKKPFQSSAATTAAVKVHPQVQPQAQQPQQKAQAAKPGPAGRAQKAATTAVAPATAGERKKLDEKPPEVEKEGASTRTIAAVLSRPGKPKTRAPSRTQT